MSAFFGSNSVGEGPFGLNQNDKLVSRKYFLFMDGIYVGMCNTARMSQKYEKIKIKNLFKRDQP